VRQAKRFMLVQGFADRNAAQDGEPIIVAAIDDT
jgi:hypothetical protein